jgi:hypothetical protein
MCLYIKCLSHLSKEMPFRRYVSSFSLFQFTLYTSNSGLDIVPLHPDLQRVGSSDLASRITWVQANLSVPLLSFCLPSTHIRSSLEGLPFPNDEFDFVSVSLLILYFSSFFDRSHSHIKRIARGVPEDKVFSSLLFFGTVFLILSSVGSSSRGSCFEPTNSVQSHAFCRKSLE